MLLQHFDNLHYQSSHHFHGMAKTCVNNQHIATFSHTKYHQASLNSFWVMLGSICLCNILTISNTIATTMFMRQRGKNVHYQHIATYSRTQFHQANVNIVFELSWDPYFNRQRNGWRANL